jgi:hypothetical protein
VKGRLVYEPHSGEEITEAARFMFDVARTMHTAVYARFNDTPIAAIWSDNDHRACVTSYWRARTFDAESAMRGCPMQPPASGE